MMKLVVLSCILAAASAGIVAPIVPLAYTAPVLLPSNYRGPLSLAPGQPANVLGSDGRPLDTLEVNLDRANHLTTKALDGWHLLKKRSAPLIAPVSTIAVAPAPVLTHAAPLTYTATIPTAHIAPLTYTARLAHW